MSEQNVGGVTLCSNCGTVEVYGKLHYCVRRPSTEPQWTGSAAMAVELASLRAELAAANAKLAEFEDVDDFPVELQVECGTFAESAQPRSEFISISKELYASLRSRLAAAKSEVAGLWKGLKPFADYAPEAKRSGFSAYGGGCEIHWRDFEKAAALLATPSASATEQPTTEGRTDGERLDWIAKEVQLGEWVWIRLSTVLGLGFYGANANAKGAHPTIRAAIDAAIETPAKGAEERNNVD